MLEHNETSVLLYFCEATELIGDVHHAVSIICDEFSSQVDASAFSQFQNVVHHDGTYTPGHHAARHEQEFDGPYFGATFHKSKANFAIGAVPVIQPGDEQFVSICLPEFIQLF